LLAAPRGLRTWPKRSAAETYCASLWRGRFMDRLVNFFVWHLVIRPDAHRLGSREPQVASTSCCSEGVGRFRR
jgi:hypothetical protein